MLTLDALCLQMEASGRSFPRRKARDWWAKGLIPRPIRRWRGRGKGSETFWNDPRVFQQAQVAHDLLARYARADSASLSLWLLGFPIELRAVRAAYSTSIERHRRSMLVQGGKAPDENVGSLAAMFARQLSNKAAAPVEARNAITELAEEFLGVFYGTDGDFTDEGLAELWQKAAPFLDASAKPDGFVRLDLRDDDLKTWADHLRTFASLPAQRKTIRSASDYELIRARRLVRYVFGFLRRMDKSVEYREDIESLGGWLLLVFGRPAVPILVAVLRQQTLRQEMMSWLLKAVCSVRKTGFYLPSSRALQSE